MRVPPRPLRLLAALAVGSACAHVEAPTGGPDDRTPPSLMITRPDTLAVVPDWSSPVVFLFDERISEQRLEEAVMVSPRTSPVAVDLGGRAVRVSLRRGWEPGTIYQVQIRPVIQDLFNNRLAEPAVVVFSTGPAIPDTRLEGAVVERITGKPDAEARVEAIRTADSLVYAVPTDSAGRFVLARIPVGDYLVRGYRDTNRNRRLDPFEPRDTAFRSVEGQDTTALRLSTVLPDTTPPRVASAQLAGDRRVELRFDDHLDPEQTLLTGAVEIAGPDGTRLPVAGVTVGAPSAAPADTAAAAPLLPSQSLTVELAEEAVLEPEETYQIVVRALRNVVGLAADAQVELEVPPAPAPAAPPAEAQDTVPPDAQRRP